MDLSLILPVIFHASSQNNILGISGIGLLVGICQTSVVAKDVLPHLHQASVSIRKAGRRIELTYPIPHGVILHMSGTNCLAQQSPSCFPIQIVLQKKRK